MSYQIFIKTWTGKCLTIDVDLNDTIGQAKVKIKEKEKLTSVDYIKAIYAGRLLQDHMTFQECLSSNLNIEIEKIKWVLRFDEILDASSEEKNSDNLTPHTYNSRFCLSCIVISGGLFALGANLLTDYFFYQKPHVSYKGHFQYQPVVGASMILISITLLFCGIRWTSRQRSQCAYSTSITLPGEDLTTLENPTHQELSDHFQPV